MLPLTYTRPSDINAALAAMSADTYFIGGGTNLLDLMKAGVEKPRKLVKPARRHTDLALLVFLHDLEAHSEAPADLDLRQPGEFARKADLPTHMTETFRTLGFQAPPARRPERR